MVKKGSSVDVEALFQTKTIAEIRIIETKTRKEIEDKQSQLRQVVGDSYRDLISSADTITAISRNANGVSSTLNILQQKIEQVSQHHTGGDDVEDNATIQSSTSSTLDKLFAVGSRIKYLIDSPETIYGCLESKEFLEAAQRYIRSLKVHKSFATHSKHSAKRFPLLRHHWPLVKKLGTDTWDRAVEWLQSQGSATPSQLASVLAALALLKPTVDGAEALKIHLTARQSYIKSCLSNPSSIIEANSSDPESIAFILADVAVLVCTTIAQCGELFLSRPGVTTRPLLVDTASQVDVGASELLFDPGSNPENSPEAQEWNAHQQDACDRVSGVAAAGVALECSQWLQGLAPIVESLCRNLLQGCGSGASLRNVEDGIQHALSSWRYTLGGTEELTWSDACQWVVGHPIALWPLLMEGPFVHRAQEIITSQFSAVSEQASELIQAAVEESASVPPCHPGKLHSGHLHWSDPTIKLVWTPEVLSPTTVSSKHSIAEKEEHNPHWWLARADNLLKTIDSNLEGALGAALAITDVDVSNSGSIGGGSALKNTTTSTKTGVNALAPHVQPSHHHPNHNPSPRAILLHPFVQDTCSASIESIATALSNVLSTARDVDNMNSLSSTTRAIYCSLFVGKVAQGLATQSTPLGILLGPPSAWTSIRNDNAKLQNRLESVANTSSPSPLLENVKKRLQTIAEKAFTVWATWASRNLAEQFILLSAADKALRADAPLRGWEEATLSGGHAGEDVKFQIPGCPSPSAMTIGMGACSEIDRAGGHLADSVAVQLLRWYLTEDICAAVTASFASDGPFLNSGQLSLSEKGLLQLLFDVRFLIGLFQGASPPPGSTSTAQSKAVASAELELSSRIDPIDLATYESLLRDKVDQFTQRSRSLLGLAMRGLSPPNKPLPNVSQPSESNILRLAPPGTRFAYLPVNTPTAVKTHHLGKVAVHKSSSLSTAMPTPTPAAALLDEESCGQKEEALHYSFATLTSARSRAQLRHGTADGTVAPEFAIGSDYIHSSGVGAAALEALRSSTLGSLLGDKAAEMSATFGEWSSLANLSSTFKR